MAEMKIPKSYIIKRLSLNKTFLVFSDYNVENFINRREYMTDSLLESYSCLFTEYLAFKKTLLSKQGFDSTRKRTKSVLLWFQQEEILFENATINDAIQYRKYISQKKTKTGNLLSKGTVQNYLKCAKSFFKWLVLIEKVKVNPFDSIEYPRLSDQIPKNILSEVQMERILDKLGHFYYEKNKKKILCRYKCHVLAEFLYSTGMRIFEASEVTLNDINIQSRKVYISCGKGGKPRTAYLTNYAADVIKVYLEVTRKKILSKYKHQNSNLLFGVTKERLAYVLNREIKEICTELSIPVITCHGFRHSLGTHLLQKGCDMRFIQEILGHESLSSTQIYTRVDKNELKSCFDEFHPRNVIKR